MDIDLMDRNDQIIDKDSLSKGEQQLYERVLTTVFANDKEYTAWIYWYKGNTAGKPLVESGDMMEYIQRRNK